MPDTSNVKLGVCQVIYDGLDLGYTKGGVEVEVSTDTHKVTVDQFGQSEINEYIQKRSCVVKLPLAETSLENMVKVLPGATLIDNAVKQVSTVDIVTAANATVYTVTVNGVKYEYTSDADATEGEIALGLVALINADPGSRFVATTTALAADAAATFVLTGKVSADVIGVTVDANMSLVETTAAANGSKRVDVTNGIGTNLLSIAKELILRPIGATDNNDDFIIPRAATAGALSFAYKFDDERIYNCEYMAYPDPDTKILFKVGDKAAV